MEVADTDSDEPEGRRGPAAHAMEVADTDFEGGTPMIFRQFLAPRTGCASYLFG
jgi:hypothetical protein